MAYSKYGAVRTEVDGIVFASKKEARRYGVLKLLERAGKINCIKVQPRYPIKVEGVLVCTYVADFFYRELHGAGKDARWVEVVEDVKGGDATKTDVYRLKRKLMMVVHGVEIREV